MKKRTWLPLIAVILIFAAGASVWYVASRDTNPVEETPAPTERFEEGQIITVSGTISCLPYRGDGPHTMECAMGLKSGNEHYALADMAPEAWSTYQTGQEVEVTGSFSKPAEDEKYDIIGTISVQTISSADGEPTGEESEMQAYTNNEYGFSFEYSANFIQLSEDDGARLPWSADSSRPGRRLVTLRLPAEFAPQSNFSEATISVGVSSDAAEVAACLLGDQGEVVGPVDINGTIFTRVGLSDAGAGNFYETSSYRILRDTTCLALETTIHSTSLDNYPAEEGRSEFDKAAVEAALDEVVRSFTFIE